MLSPDRLMVAGWIRMRNSWNMVVAVTECTGWLARLYGMVGRFVFYLK